MSDLPLGQSQIFSPCAVFHQYEKKSVEIFYLFLNMKIRQKTKVILYSIHKSHKIILHDLLKIFLQGI